MRILELTTFSAGICGVWARVKEESIGLSKLGHEVAIFSSNFTKGSKEIAKERDKIEKVAIRRFPARKLGGESFMSWNFENEALNFSPDVIIAHSYRQTHTLKALKIAEALKKRGKKCKVFLVTHAPFARSSTRSILARMVVWGYDRFIAPRYINNFDKVITITQWEEPYLLDIELKKDKIAYIPNGIPEEFFIKKKTVKEENKILFLGRISPIKSIETVISAISLLKDKSLTFDIVGPAEEDYLRKLNEIIEKEGVEKRVTFSSPIYYVDKKIKKIDSARIFVLPSKSEGMPQSLIEAMARGKIVISSNNLAGKEFIRDGKNGFLFKVGDFRELAKKIDLIIEKKDTSIRKETRRSVEKFRWGKIIKSLNELIKL